MTREASPSLRLPESGRIVVTGSVAFDYLMRFPGRFVEHLIPDRMERLSVSFLVDEMRRVPGGCGANIAYGLALLGEKPLLLATAGRDAADYRDWLGRHGVDVSGLRIHEDVFTASFFVSTDRDQNQLASFYTGAMARARDLPLSYDTEWMAPRWRSLPAPNSSPSPVSPPLRHRSGPMLPHQGNG